MKTIEEKAKAYDFAIEKAKELMTKGYDVLMPELFPELADSEDERIRKEIVSLVLKILGQEKDSLSDKKYDSMLHWLERQKEQKPENYDHEMWKNCEANFEGGKKEVIDNPEKYGLCKKAEWSYPYGKNETVDQLIALAECLEMDGDCSFNGYKGKDCGKFLRELARRESENKPAEWSEEDDRMFNLVVECIEREERDGTITRSEAKKIFSMLKSLRPRWKPSEEQMKALEAAILIYAHGLDNKEVADKLQSLFDDLEKL